MTSKIWSAGTVIDSPWLQDTDNTVYKGILPILKVGDSTLFGYVDNTLAQIYKTNATPTGIQQTLRVITSGKGDNTTFKGVVSGYFEARDRSDVNAGNKGVLYALSLSVVPSIARSNVPFDDVDGLTISNTTGTVGAKATDAIYISNNTFAFGDRLTGTSEWYSIFTADNNADVGIALNGKLASFAIDLGLANLPSSSAIRFPNATYLVARNAGNTTNLNLIGLDANNIVNLGGTNVSGVQVKNCWFGTTVPNLQVGATYTVAFTDNWITFNSAGTTVTLPNAPSFPGREIKLRTIAAAAIISASANVVPLVGGAAGTAILAATAGKWATLVSDGAVWQTTQAN